MREKQVFDTSTSVLDTCAASGLSLTDQLLAVQLAWLTLSGNQRDTALSVPGGFPAVQARQLDHLEKMALVVRNGSTGVEAGRLLQERDRARLLDRCHPVDVDGREEIAADEISAQARDLLHSSSNPLRVAS